MGRTNYRKRLSWNCQGKHIVLIVSFGALCVAAVFLTATVLLASCSARIASVVAPDGSARLSIRAEVPAPLAAKFRRLAASGQQPSGQALPLFDAAAIRRSISTHPGLNLIELSQPNLDSIQFEAMVRSLELLAASPDLKDSGLLSITRGAGWTEWRIHLGRDRAKMVSALFPGIDPNLLEALSPPALEEDPLSSDEYRTMLTGILGEKTMPAMEEAAITLSLTAPGKVLASGGGKLDGTTLTATIPVLQALVLEKPIELWLRWESS
jgi:hypothetical protein